jgi:hypothetical protein
MKQSILERFWRHASPEPNSGCWLWDGARNAKGYGLLGNRMSGRSQLAHRVAYELFCESIPEGKVLDHLCRVKCCVNPDHLRPLSREENSDGNRRKTRCPKGHLYDLAQDIGGRRVRRCRQCRREYLQEYQRNYQRRER